MTGVNTPSTVNHEAAGLPLAGSMARVYALLLAAGEKHAAGEQQEQGAAVTKGTAGPVVHQAGGGA